MGDRRETSITADGAICGCALDVNSYSSIALLDFARLADNFWIGLRICDQEIEG
jgi:hypothetical protein